MAWMPSEVDVAIVGAGAAGLGAGRLLHDAGIPVVVLEARARPGGRAHTAASGIGHPLDLGCGWLHSADRNPWVAIAESHGFAIDRTPPGWGRQTEDIGFSRQEQDDFHAAADAFHQRLDEAAEAEPDRPAADFLEPGGRWNALLDAISGFANGVELARLSVRDHGRYADTSTNWRVTAGYGTLVARHGEGVPVVLDAAVTRIEHGRRPVRLLTASGAAVSAKAAIVTVPTSLLARETIRFDPPLDDKLAAADKIPLGLADKVFLEFLEPEMFPSDGHLIGRTDRVETMSFHLRPFGRPLIEAYVGGSFAAGLEREGEAAAADFAIGQLADLVGNGIRRKLRPLAVTAWGLDPLALGSYSAALPGHAEDRAVLAAPVADRLFFAGEATSRHDFSTAHGALRTGEEAARAAAKAIGRPFPEPREE
jgi:monoamine oxidase